MSFAIAVVLGTAIMCAIEPRHAVGEAKGYDRAP